MKLLIVDDSAMVRRLIEAAYRGSVFTEIQTAADGLLAVTMYKQFTPDVVTLDITMPHMDGLAALAQIREHNPRAKVLVISALADHHTAIESLKRGASQFICKPFTAEDLRSSLDEVINPEVARGGRARRRRRERNAPTHTQIVNPASSGPLSPPATVPLSPPATAPLSPPATAPLSPPATTPLPLPTGPPTPTPPAATPVTPQPIKPGGSASSQPSMIPFPTPRSGPVPPPTSPVQQDYPSGYVAPLTKQPQALRPPSMD